MAQESKPLVVALLLCLMIAKGKSIIKTKKSSSHHKIHSITIC